MACSDLINQSALPMVALERQSKNGRHRSKVDFVCFFLNRRRETTATSPWWTDPFRFIHRIRPGFWLDRRAFSMSFHRWLLRSHVSCPTLSIQSCLDLISSIFIGRDWVFFGSTVLTWRIGIIKSYSFNDWLIGLDQVQAGLARLGVDGTGFLNSRR